VYAVQGEDRPKVERAVERLLRRVAAEGGMDADRFSAADTGAAEVAGACQALSLGGTRAVIVDAADAWRAGDVEPLLAYLDDPNPTTVLALVSDGPLPQRLQQAVERAGQVLHWGPPPKAKAAERRRWLEHYLVQEADRHGARIGPAVARLVVDRICTSPGDAKHTPMNATLLACEAEKLAACAGAEPVTRELVLEVTPQLPEAKAYELADALVRADAPDAQRALHDMADGDRVEPIVIAMTLMSHFRALAIVQALGPGVSADRVSEATGVRGYPARKLAEQGPTLPAGAAERAVARLARLELDLRVSSLRDLGRSPDDGRRFVLERAARDLVAIAAGAPGS
jgi:DNA polymerase III delta subunit